MPRKKSDPSDAVKLKKLVEIRSEFAKRRPAFVRPESWRYDRLSPEWRKPKGLDNKVRKSKKGWPRRAKVGYRGPLVSRYLHPSGHYEVMVHNQGELESLVPGRDVARMGATVGARKRALILRRAKGLGGRGGNPAGVRRVGESKKEEKARGRCARRGGGDFEGLVLEPLQAGEGRTSQGGQAPPRTDEGGEAVDEASPRPDPAKEEDGTHRLQR